MTEPTKIVLDVNPNAYQSRTYGIPWVSRTHQRVTGRGVHNPSFPHTVDVWDNTLRPVEGKPGVYIDPAGFETFERASFMLSPGAIVISSMPNGDHQAEGPSIAVGEVIELSLGYLTSEISLGLFEVVVPRSAYNPELRKVQ